MDSFFSHGMDKLQDPRMETKTVCGGEFITMSVLAIAQDRVAYRRQMYTYLVGAPSLEIEFQEGEGQRSCVIKIIFAGAFQYFVTAICPPSSTGEEYTTALRLSSVSHVVILS